MQLTENEREYLKLVAKARTSVWSPPERARRNIDEEELREAGIDEKYVKRPDRFHYSDDESNNKSIEEKVEELPNRVESLIRDVELLYATGYLDTEHWHADLNEVLPDQETEEESNPPLNAQYGFEKPHKELGNRLGGVATSLSSRSRTNLDTVQFYKEVVEGFMYAIGYVMGGDKRVDLYSELAEKMEELNGRASKSLELPSERIPEWRSELKKEIQSCVETRLQQEGYETPEEFVRKVRSKIAHEYIQEGYKMIWDAVADDENPADRERWNVEEHITREQVRRVVEENSLYIGYRIRNRMRTDLDELLSFSRRDITAGEVLVSVPTDGGEVGEIAQDVSNHTEKGERQTIPVVAKLSRFMSCEEDPQLGQWRGNKIVSLNRDADRMDDWVVEPTEYGKLLKSNVKLRTVKSAKKREGSIFDSRYLFAALDVPDEILRNPDERFDL